MWERLLERLLDGIDLFLERRAAEWTLLMGAIAVVPLQQRCA